MLRFISGRLANVFYQAYVYDNGFESQHKVRLLDSKFVYDFYGEFWFDVEKCNWDNKINFEEVFKRLDKQQQTICLFYLDLLHNL